MRRGNPKVDRTKQGFGDLAIATFNVEDISGPEVLVTQVSNIRETQATPFRIQVVFEDETGIRASSVNRDGVIRVTGPNNFDRLLPFFESSTSLDAATIVVTYEVFPSIDESLNGVYQVLIEPDIVEDVNGVLTAKVGVLSSFSIAISVADDIAPVVTLFEQPPPIEIENSDTKAIQIKVTDNVELDFTSFDSRNLIAVTPDGDVLAVELEAVNQRSIVEAIATYRISPPQGGWRYEVNGTYNFGPGASRIKDSSGNEAVMATGSFQVVVPVLAYRLTTSARQMPWIVPSGSRNFSRIPNFTMDWGDGTQLRVVEGVTQEPAPGLTGASGHDYDATGSVLPTHTISCFTTEPEAIQRLFWRGRRIDSILEISPLLTQLQIIDIRDNFLTELTVLRSEWTNFSHLIAQRNAITTLSPIPSTWVNLDQVYLEENALSEPIVLSRGMTRFRQLNMSGQLLSGPVEIYPEMTILDRYILGNAGIVDTPTFYPQNTEIKLITLSGNQLTQKLLLYSSMTKIVSIILNSNQFTESPDLFAEMTALEGFYAEENQISASPPFFSTMTSLREINLRSNNLTLAPSLPAELVSLERLSLGFNRISNHPDLRPEFVNMKILDLTSLAYTGELSTPDGYVRLEEFRINNAAVSGFNLSEEWSSLKILAMGGTTGIVAQKQLPTSYTQLTNLDLSGWHYSTPPVIPEELVALEIVNISQLVNATSFPRFSNAFQNLTRITAVQCAQITSTAAITQLVDDLSVYGPHPEAGVTRQLILSGTPAAALMSQAQLITLQANWSVTF